MLGSQTVVGPLRLFRCAIKAGHVTRTITGAGARGSDDVRRLPLAAPLVLKLALSLQRFISGHRANCVLGRALYTLANRAGFLADSVLAIFHLVASRLAKRRQHGKRSATAIPYAPAQLQ